MRRCILVILLCCSTLLLPTLMKRWTQGFRLAKTRLEFPFHSEWEIPMDQAVLPILNQPFHYLDKGSQCYVFESEDGEYVVKLFRYDHPPNASKVLHLFNACKAAYDRLKEETGLIFVHLNPTPMGLGKILCKDPLGRSFELDLDSCRFAVQKRAQLFRKTLEMAKGNPEEMKKKLDQFLDLLKTRAKAQVLNSDPTLSRNFGFLADRAIELDFGNFRPCDEINETHEIKRYTGRLKRWLTIHAPSWVSYIEEQEDAL